MCCMCSVCNVRMFLHLKCVSCVRVCGHNTRAPSSSCVFYQPGDLNGAIPSTNLSCQYLWLEIIKFPIPSCLHKRESAHISCLIETTLR